VEAYVRHYGGRFKVMFLEDEIHSGFLAKDFKRFIRVYKAAYARAKKTAKEMGVELSIGVNATYPRFWKRVFAAMPVQQIDVIASNSVCRPRYASEILNDARKRGVKVAWYRTAGVGWHSQWRKTSLIVDRGSIALHSGYPPGAYAWTFLHHYWQSRPYGVEDLRHGPMVNLGYYDLRVLGQTNYLPFAGKTGVEYDNSPTLGMQAMAMLKHQIQGMRPVRDHTKPFTMIGSPTAGGKLYAYPFRDRDKATIVLCVAGKDFDAVRSAWDLGDVDFTDLDPRDLYAQPLKPGKDGTIRTRDLPVYLHVQAAQINAVLGRLRKMTAQTVPSPERRAVAVAPFELEIDAGRSGYVRLFKRIDGKRTLIVNGLAGKPALPKPRLVHAEERPLVAGADLDFGDGRRLSVALTSHAATFRWSHPATAKGSPARSATFRLGPAAGGRDIVIRTADSVTTGHLRQDFGVIERKEVAHEKTGLDANAQEVAIKGYVTFGMSASDPRRKGAPSPGFRWHTSDGEAFLHFAGAPNAGTATLRVAAP